MLKRFMNFGSNNRVFILGNSGSGKSWLSNFLSDYLDHKNRPLDEICWEPGGYCKRRSQVDIENQLKLISQKPSWIIEGVYGDLAELLIPRLTHFFWLDLDPIFCSESVSKRGFDYIPWMNTQEKINDYLDHIQSYQISSGPMSREFHQRIFNNFNGEKITFISRKQVNDFVKNLISSSDSNNSCKF